MNNTFSHIYVEKDVFDLEICQQILSHFQSATVIMIDHYKDVFCRSKQNFAMQKKSQALILAQKNGELIYPGANVCQSFGNAHFYYTSCIMNCIFDCEYCYLSGMYPSGNIVIFLNIDNYFEEVEKLLAQHEVYLCISYDTDLLALNAVTGLLNKWIEFTDNHDNLTIEVRSKCGNLSSIIPTLEKVKHKERIIFAYTISPNHVVAKYEKYTSPLESRLQAISTLQQMNFPCRIAFDPMIYVTDWKEVYSSLLNTVFSSKGDNAIDSNRLIDISIGSFRISSAYLKNMRKIAPKSAITQFPYEVTNGVYHYPQQLLDEMESFMLDGCAKYISKEKIYLWQD